MSQIKIVDLSHPILDRAPCTFSAADKVPIVTFEEGDSHGAFFVTSRLDNFYSNTGTQIDFPGHLVNATPSATRGLPSYPTVGEYPLERFIGPCAVIDVSAKTKSIENWFDHQGVFRRDKMPDFADFVVALRGLEVTVDDFQRALKNSGASGLDGLTGVLLFSGNAVYWSYEVFESWEYRYFYAPFLSREVTNLLVDSRISLLGIDAFQLENPIANFRGDELPLVINVEARKLIRDQQAAWRDGTNHELLLGNGVIIYESLSIPSFLAGRTGHFSGPPLNLQLAGVDDDAVARPYIVINWDE